MIYWCWVRLPWGTEASQSFNLSASEIDGWVHKAQQAKRIGVAKGHFDMPESIDAYNNEIVALFVKRGL